ncbi:MAG: hypothetical protein BroJett011_59300 [Chloroflexota bacterium]|nr:MAG: hypothetical protein BroJett011_59300 [Chloroflexota bacterium]
MGDLFLGISRTIDHAVYMTLNAIAIILWRIDAAIIQFSLFSYVTEDWLMGKSDGSLWKVMDYVVGSNGIFGLSTWEALLALALTLYGFSLLIRPFWRVQPVNIGKLFFYATLSYVLISQGNSLMQSIEEWRGEAGGYMYEILAAGGSTNLDIPGGAQDDEPIGQPADLDGHRPLRGWEAVSTSYFLVTDADELHDGVPPEDFRREYCLYDPSEPINDQDDENDEGCSPKKAWDEWDVISTGVITEVWGIPLPVEIGASTPIIREHAENRELAIRQAQEGVARLALGPIVSLFPWLEANVGMMLALAAAFIYLSLPIVFLFGFFTYTEPMVNRLVMQLIGILLRTIILNGILALYLMLLIGVSVNGSLMAYLGLIGVGLIGGFFLTKIATGTMKESLTTSMGAIGGIWMGATVGTMGEGARQPALMTMGAAKWAAVGAGLGALGVRMWDGWEASRELLRSGSQDINQAAPGAMQTVANPAYQAVGQLPTPLANLAKSEISEITAQSDVANASRRAANQRNGNDGGSEWIDTTTTLMGNLASTVPTFGAGASAGGWFGGSQRERETPPAPVYMGPNTVEGWANQVYQAREQGRGEQQVLETGQVVLGENLSRQAYQAMTRHSREETMAVLQAARQAAVDRGGIEHLVQPDGTLTNEGIQMVRGRLDDNVAETFTGRQGERDLEILVAAGLQPQKRAEPGEFRNATARANKWEGPAAAGHMIPRSLGLDPVASGANFAALNRFTRLSNQAGLDEEQRKQLLEAVRQDGEVSPEFRRELESILRRQQERGLGSHLSIDDLVDSAQAMPDTLEGPMLMRISKLKRGSEFEPEGVSVGTVKGVISDQPELPSRLVGPAEEPAVQSDFKKGIAQKSGQVSVGDRPAEASNLVAGKDKETKKAADVPVKSKIREAQKVGGTLGGSKTHEAQESVEGMVSGVSRSVKGVSSSLIEDEAIKEKASELRQQRQQQREILPSLRQLDEEESLIGDGAIGLGTRKGDPVQTPKKKN